MTGPSPGTGRKPRHALTVVPLLMMLAVMVGIVSYSSTLYRMFCQVTGYGGTTRVAEAPAGRVLDRVVTVRFNADVNDRLQWRFAPASEPMKVRLGESTLAFFRAENLSDTAITGTATFNVTPQKVGAYFNKIECFCFTEQTLQPGQVVDMPVQFFVDPALADDPNMADIKTITLSYTFFRSPEQDQPQQAAARSGEKSVPKTRNLN